MKPQEQAWYTPWIKRVWARGLTSQSPHHTWMMTLLIVVVLTVALLAALRLDLNAATISWLLLLAALAVSLASPLLSAAEYRLTLRLTGYESDLKTALQVSVYGSVANTLPLPGGIALRLKAMTEQGVRARRAVAASILTGLIWLTLSALALAVAVPNLRVPSVVVALALLTASIVLLRSTGFPLPTVANIFVIESMFVVSSATRFLLCLTGAGLGATVSQAIGLSASGPVASAMGLVPAGLGVFEGLSAGIAIVVGLTASEGFLAAVILRVLSFTALLTWIPVIQSGYLRRAE